VICYAVNYRPSAWRDQTVDEIVRIQRQACAAADIAVMNREEACTITGAAAPDVASRRISELGPSTVVVTSGEDGATLVSDDGTVHVPARDVEVVYDIGAGDTFHAGLLAGLLNGMSPEDATRLGADAAALRISRDATAPNPSLDEVLQWGQHGCP
jgi:sugar/nucleoside kinase (ribokinase family)